MTSIEEGLQVFDYNRILTELERVWLACAIDTDGFISWTTWKTPSNPKRYARIGIYNTDIKFAEYSSKLLQSKIRTHQNKSFIVTKNPKTMYIVDVSGTKAQNILQQIYPYLIIKRDKAIELLTVKIKTRYEHMVFLNSKNHPRDLKTGRYLPKEKILS